MVKDRGTRESRYSRDQLEIEIKYRVLDKKLNPKRICRILFPGSWSPARRADIYLFQCARLSLRNMAKSPFVRVRDTGNDKSIELTTKKRGFSGNREINSEHSIQIKKSEKPLILEFFSALGFKSKIEKSKKGFVKKRGRLSLEVWEVEKAGIFLEVEVISPKNTKEGLSILKGLQSEIKKKFGPALVPETRPYLDLIHTAR